MNQRNALHLQLAEHDKTFGLQDVRGEKLWVGKCIHCNSKIAIQENGQLVSATLEHIVPKVHGGTDDLENLALACKQCNQSKGLRVDNRNRNDPKLTAMIERLQQRKAERKR